MSNLIVSRFGGDAAVNSEEVKKAVEIIKSDPARRYVIISAPGSTSENIGITDLLYMCHSNFKNNENYVSILKTISNRYKEIVDGLGINFDVDNEITFLKNNLEFGIELDYIASRGEYIMSKIFAQALGWKFVDAYKLIFFDKDGIPDKEKTFKTAGLKLKEFERAVIPSFYGVLPNGKIKTFVRGDCDTAGALIACAVNADLFEKWSSTEKVYSADTSLIPDAKIIKNITYMEALAMNYTGINIIKDEVIFMLNKFEIPMKISGIHDSDDDAILISPKLPENISRNTAVCIAGLKNFTAVHIHKNGLIKILDFSEKLFEIFSKRRIVCQHFVSSINDVLIALKSPSFDLRRKEIFDELEEIIKPDSISVEKNLSLILIVGEGIGTVKGIFSKIFSALALAGIKLKVISQGSDDLNIILGVYDDNYEDAVKAIYNAVIR